MLQGVSNLFYKYWIKKCYLSTLISFFSGKSLEYFDSGKIESEPEEDIDHDSSKEEVIEKETISDTKVNQRETANNTKDKERKLTDTSEQNVIDLTCESVEKDLENFLDESEQEEEEIDHNNETRMVDTPEQNVVDLTCESVEQDLQHFLSETGSHKKVSTYYFYITFCSDLIYNEILIVKNLCGWGSNF